MTPNSVDLIRLAVFSEVYKESNAPFRRVGEAVTGAVLDENTREDIEERVRERIMTILERGGRVHGLEDDPARDVPEN